MKFKTLFSAGVMALGLAFSALVNAGNIEVNTDENDVAVEGYDTVAYFTENAAVEGSAEYTAVHHGAIYKFSSKKNRDLFKENPEKYLPAYGGFCAYGVTKYRKFDIDPEAFKIVDGKLYLNLKKSVQKRWVKDLDDNISEGNEAWGEIVALTDKELKDKF